MPSGNTMANGQPAPNLYCAVIVKRVDEKTRAKTSVNDLKIEVQPLTKDLANQLGYSDDVNGVVITSVEPGSAAEDAGLRGPTGPTPPASGADSGWISLYTVSCIPYAESVEGGWRYAPPTAAEDGTRLGRAPRLMRGRSAR